MHSQSKLQTNTRGKGEEHMSRDTNRAMHTRIQILSPRPSPHHVQQQQRKTKPQSSLGSPPGLITASNKQGRHK